MNELISVATLQNKIASDEVLVFDCRFNLMDPAAGHEAYLSGHIPGAVHADLNRQLSSPHIPGRTGRHPLPDKAAWLAQVQRLREERPDWDETAIREAIRLASDGKALQYLM